MLSREQRSFYRENGYLLVEEVLEPQRLAEMRKVTLELIEASRSVAESNERYDLDDGHGPQRPRLSRIKLPTRIDPVFDRALRESAITEVLRDLLGDNVTLLTSKLNTKAPGGGAAVEWHQDWAFYPHSNDSLLACGVMLDDVTPDNGPLMVIPGSHRGPVLSHHGPDGRFCGAVDPDDPQFEFERAVTLTGRAGSMTVHHVRTLHGSAPNHSDRARLVLFYECAAADAWPLVGGGSYIHGLNQQELWEDIQQRMVCGEPSLQPRVETAPVRVPLPPAPNATSIFKTQKSGGARSAFAP